jgi:hypothetical protein
MQTHEMKKPHSERHLEPRALSDAELDQVGGGFILQAAALVVGFFAGYGAVRLGEDLGATGTLGPALHRSAQ